MHEPGRVVDLGAVRRVLVFGGPYGNVRAVRAVREIAGTLSPAPDRIVCTGDTVAYCAEPNVHDPVFT